MFNHSIAPSDLEGSFWIHLFVDISISIQVQALCSVVVWYNPDVSCERMITGYDVRFYSLHSDTKNVTRRTGANQTFYIIQNEDGLADKHDINVQVKFHSSNWYASQYIY